MIELSEKDIRAIARARFWDKYQWRLVIYLILTLVAALVTAVLTTTDWPALVVTVGLFTIGFIWWLRRQRAWEGRLVNEWKKSLMK